MLSLSGLQGFWVALSLLRPGLGGLDSWNRPQGLGGFPVGLCHPVLLSPGLRGCGVERARWSRSPEMSRAWVTTVLVPQARASPHLTAGSDLRMPVHEAALPFYIQPHWDRGWAMSPD